MKLPRRLLSAVLALAAFAPAFGAPEAGPRPRGALQLDTAHARVIVKYRATSTLMRMQTASASAAAVLPRHADALGKRLGLVLVDGHALGARTQALRARGIGSEALALRLAAQADVEWALPDRRRTINAVVPNDPRYGANQTTITPAAGQWYLRTPDATLVSGIDAVGAWSRTLGSPTVTVAVLDTGVRFDHPDLVGKLHPGYDFVAEDPDGSFYSANDGDGRDSDPSDPGDWDAACDSPTSSWHGTQTAGLVGAATDNAIGMAGSGRNVMVLPVRVLGRCGGYDSDILAGMRWAAGLDTALANPHPAKVMNMSLGSPGACDAAYTDAMAELVAAGVSVVVSSGNEGGPVGAPANCPGAIAVAGVRHAGTKVGYSNVGVENFIAAPAGNCVNDTGLCLYPLLTTVNSGVTTPAGHTYSDGLDNISVGTSFASPLVAGVIGLMLSQDPTLTPARIRDVLKATARPFPTSTTVASCRPTSTTLQDSECYCTTASCGAGLLDAAAAARAVGAGGVLPPVITITASTTSPVRNTSVTLDASGTRADGGRTITGYRWTVVGGGDVGQITPGAGGVATTWVLLNRAGEVTVQLVATDSGGHASTSSITLYAQEAPADGGGGAMSTLWNALVGLAVLVLGWQRRRPARS